MDNNTGTLKNIDGRENVKLTKLAKCAGCGASKAFGL